MTINNEAMAEIDIKASQLTIYHAMIASVSGARAARPVTQDCNALSRPLATQCFRL
jgi:hypothetical protein